MSESLSSKTLSIVIPIFNEKNTVKTLVEKVLAANTLGMARQIILVDDGSTDGSAEIVRSLASSSIKKIFHRHNQGKAAALRSGFKLVTGDIILIQDADFEYDPANYPLLLKPFFDEEVEVVYGSRFLSGKKSSYLHPVHFLLNKSLTLLSNHFSGLKLSDMETGYKLFRRKVLTYILPQLKTDRFCFEPEFASLIGKLLGAKDGIREVGISYSPRNYREGKKIGSKDYFEAILWLLTHGRKS